MKEIIKDIPDCPGYKISNLGKVYNPKGKEIGYINSCKYISVDLPIGSCRLHRLVASIFIPNPQELPVVNHKDTNRLNNRIDNLEWVTHEENGTHANINSYKDKQKAVLCIDNNKQFDSIKDAAIWLSAETNQNNIQGMRRRISVSLKNGHRVGGYKFKFI